MVIVAGALWLVVLAAPGAMAQPAAAVKVNWSHTTRTVVSTATMQVVVNPMLRRGSPIHNQIFSAIKNLGADYVRYVPWLPYPKLAVAELKPPTATESFWDFSLIDPMMEDFMTATAGHSVIINYSTIPQWMFKTPKPVAYPADPNQVDWHYEQGTELRDPSLKELGDYYGRLVSWYTRGGFTDEHGTFHKSGHHYDIPYWEVLNEVNGEHDTTPELYTREYDAIVSSIRKVDPKMKFIGIALGGSDDPAMFEYFLNHAHHQPGIPLDYISYHFYASPTRDQSIQNWQYTFFNQADGFLSQVKFINAIRDRLSPETKTDTDELGVILPTDNPGDNYPGKTVEQLADEIPPTYWNLAGSLYAYLYVGLAKDGINVIGESQLVGYPTQFPSVSMINWKTGQPNARYWVLKLIKDNFGPGDKMIATDQNSSDVMAQAFVTPGGRKLLIANKRDRTVDLHLPADTVGATTETVDLSTGDGPWKTGKLSQAAITLAPFAVTVVTLK